MTSDAAAQALASLLGIRLPIIQAPMAGISSPAMAAAVSNAGALGSISIGNLDIERAARAITEVRALTTRPFNVNVFCHRPARRDAELEAGWLDRLRPEFTRRGGVPPAALAEPFQRFQDNRPLLDLLVAQRIPVVSFHFGLPGREAIRALRAAGSLLMATATNLSEARRVSDASVDVVIAQGIEAGGHRGLFQPDALDEGLGTMRLTRLLSIHIDLPIVAAGGLMDGAEIALALRQGASAAQLGTAFLATDESLATAAHRAALTNRRTVVTRALSGRPARAIANKLTRLGEGVAAADIPDFPVAHDAARALDTLASRRHEADFGSHWAGRGAARVRAMPAATLVAALADELAAAGGVNAERR